MFRGAGWNVIKVIWGSNWDPLLARDNIGRLVQLMNECVDGDYQTFKSNDGTYVREHFFGRYPETAALVADWTRRRDLGSAARRPRSAQGVCRVQCRGETRGEPTVVLAKTIKGYGMGSSGEAQNIAHQQKHLDLEAMRAFRDRFAIPVSDAESAERPVLPPARRQSEIELSARAPARARQVPQRRRKPRSA